MNRPARDGLITALVATAAWVAAGLIWLLTGHLSLVLVVAPFAWGLVEAAARARKARLARVVEAAFRRIEADEDSDFSGGSARVLARRARLLGFMPPRLIELRLVSMASGNHYVVRAELRRESEAVQWRVTRVSAEQVQQWLRDLA